MSDAPVPLRFTSPPYIVICDDGDESTNRFVGPFYGSNTERSDEAATAWARHHFRNQPDKWLAVPLEQPEPIPT